MVQVISCLLKLQGILDWIQQDILFTKLPFFHENTSIQLKLSRLTSAGSAVGGKTDISAGSSDSGVGGELNLSSGASSSSAGGELNVIAGSSSSGSGGGVSMVSGSSVSGAGGGLT